MLDWDKEKYGYSCLDSSQLHVFTIEQVNNRYYLYFTESVYDSFNDTFQLSDTLKDNIGIYDTLEVAKQSAEEYDKQWNG